MHAPAAPVAEEGRQPEVKNVYQNNYAGSESTENFGTSPLIKSQDWQTPAYARRECRYSEQAVETVVGQSLKTDVREEVSAFKRTRRKNRRIYREPALRMAC